MDKNYNDRRHYQIRDDLYQDFQTAFEILRELGVDVLGKGNQQEKPSASIKQRERFDLTK